MKRLPISMVAAVLTVAIGLAACGTQLDDVALQPQSAPAFMPRIYADGEVWGTKGNATLPAPNDNNRQSFDKLFKVANSNNPAGQLPISEAGPGNPAYNGGRWAAYTAEQMQAAFAGLGTVPVLTSCDDVGWGTSPTRWSPLPPARNPRSARPLGLRRVRVDPTSRQRHATRPQHHG